MKIKAILGPRTENGTRTATGVMTVDQVMETFFVDEYKHSFNPKTGRGVTTKSGYQRNAAPKRVESMAKDILNSGSVYVTSVLFNYREPSNTSVRNTTNPDGVIDIDLTPDCLSTMDGQHRLKAIKEAYSQLKDGGSSGVKGINQKTFGDRKIFFTMLLGAAVDDEIETFYIVNSKQKSIPTGNKIELEAFQGRADEVTSELVNITYELAENSKEWIGIIKFPNSREGILPNSGLISSLKPIYKDENIKGMSYEEKINLINAFWAGLEKVLPECFEDPASYSLQKAIGVNVMHALLPGVYAEFIRHNAETRSVAGLIDVHSPEAWAQKLKGLKQFTDQDGQTPSERVKGSEFWVKGKLGGAGKFSSGQGRKDLIDKLRLEIGI